MKIRAVFRHATLALAGAAALTLTACSDNGGSQAPQAPDDAATVTSPAVEGDTSINPDGDGDRDRADVSAPVGEPTTQTQTQAENQGQAAEPAPQPGSRPAEGPPCEVSGYTENAERALTEENVGKDEVVHVVAEGCSDNGEVGWEDEGYWEIGLDGTDVDIYPNGVVNEVDR
ncbi:hypothetical protein [Corynebacterium halotolerans]|uniref:PepSY domain-containing protein n=1 Tax=Corynebacterium halotolerans YIM 70093 = DSM 44683 TaxID=1121362 RepID=M1P1K3_9CORY|nr:hypothetical protein [Corynebacterium halotolerans]AGF73690.1 hypothetical protein A605_13470 [Corynebacterium halotolerans YIM 70093 = DSM 44683]